MLTFLFKGNRYELSYEKINKEKHYFLCLTEFYREKSERIDEVSLATSEEDFLKYTDVDDFCLIDEEKLLEWAFSYLSNHVGTCEECSAERLTYEFGLNINEESNFLCRDCLIKMYLKQDLKRLSIFDEVENNLKSKRTSILGNFKSEFEAMNELKKMDLKNYPELDNEEYILGIQQIDDFTYYPFIAFIPDKKDEDSFVILLYFATGIDYLVPPILANKYLGKPFLKVYPPSKIIIFKKLNTPFKQDFVEYLKERFTDNVKVKERPL